MGLLTDLLTDLKLGVRLLTRNPGFALVAALSLALGIGGTTAIFTLIDAVVLRALPVAQPGQLHVVEFREATRNPAARISYPLYNEVRSNLRGRAELCGVSGATRMLVADPSSSARGTMARVQLMTGECFGTLGVRPALGRLLSPADDQKLDGHPVAVISDGFWSRQFGRTPDVVGRNATVNGVPMTIVGVASPEFFGLSIDQRIDVWAPAMMQFSLKYDGNVSSDNGQDDSAWVPQREISWLMLFLRIPDAGRTGEVAARVNALVQQDFAGRQSYQSNADARRHFQAVRAALEPADRGVSRLRRTLQAPLTVLLVMVSLLLLIACANIAGLLMAKSAARRRELAVRVSIGASAGRLVRQLLAESVLLAVVGGAGGLLVARWATDALLALFMPADTNTAVDAVMDARVLGFALVVSMATAVLFGLLPALRASRVSPAETLSATSRGVVGASGGSRRLPLGRVLVAGQIAVTVLLLSAAALFGRTLMAVAGVDLGFTRDGVLLLRIDPVAAGYSTERLPQLYRDLLTRVTAVPGVVSAGFSLNGPLSNSRRSSSLAVEGYVHGRDERPELQEDIVAGEYFKTLGLSLVAGRTFGPDDTAKGRQVSVINETMARRYFHGRSPIGLHWAYGDDMEGAFEIVGVVRDARYNDLREPTPSLSYRPLDQSVESLGGLEVRVSGPAAPLAPSIRRAIEAVDPRLPILETTTLAARAGEQLAQERMLALLTTIFGVMALLLACLGLYGTMSFSVARRTSELGVRMALGARGADVLWLILREAVFVVGIGLAAGVPLSYWAANRLGGLLFNVTANDSTSHLTAIGVLATVAALAALLPARRAAKLDPMRALRTE